MAGEPPALGRDNRSVGTSQRELWLMNEGQPGGVRCDARGEALQEPGAQFAFEPADLLAKRLSVDADLYRSATHAA